LKKYLPRKRLCQGSNGLAGGPQAKKKGGDREDLRASGEKVVEGNGRGMWAYCWGAIWKEEINVCYGVAGYRDAGVWKRGLGRKRNQGFPREGVTKERVPGTNG